MPVPVWWLGAARQRTARGWHGRCGGASVTRPHQHSAVLVDGALLDRNKLVLEIFQEGVVQGKLALQGAIGDPLVLLDQSMTWASTSLKVMTLPPLGCVHHCVYVRQRIVP